MSSASWAPVREFGPRVMGSSQVVFRRDLGFTGNSRLAKAASIPVESIMGFDIFFGDRLEKLAAPHLVVALFREGVDRTTRDTLSA